VAGVPLVVRVPQFDKPMSTLSLLTLLLQIVLGMKKKEVNRDADVLVLTSGSY
jgi:hypothetical protein